MKLISLLGCLLLVACGFQLHNHDALNGRHVKIVNYTGNKMLFNELSNRLMLAGAHTTASDNKAVVLELQNLNTTRQVIASGGYGQGQVFIISSCIDMKINNQPYQLCIKRRVSENYNQQLGNLNNLEDTKISLQHELVNLILLKIGSLHA